MNELISQMNTYYARRASRHDYFMSYTSNEDMEELLREIINVVSSLVMDKNVLEVACGTGNWTQVIAKRARSVVATDLIESALGIARAKKHVTDVSFLIADAYDLSGVNGSFDTAFMADWWSHIPKSRIRAYLKGLHSRLQGGATVVIIDMLPSKSVCQWPSFIDGEGNLVQRRRFPEPDGDEYEVVKNFPNEAELITMLTGLAQEIQFQEFYKLRRWMLTYKTA